MGPTMKICEKEVGKRLREETEVSENWFGIMSGKSTMKPKFCVGRLIKECRVKRRNFSTVFVDLEKAYDDRVPGKVIWGF